MRLQKKTGFVLTQDFLPWDGWSPTRALRFFDPSLWPFDGVIIFYIVSIHLATTPIHKYYVGRKSSYRSVVHVVNFLNALLEPFVQNVYNGRSVFHICIKFSGILQRIWWKNRPWLHATSIAPALQIRKHSNISEVVRNMCMRRDVPFNCLKRHDRSSASLKAATLAWDLISRLQRGTSVFWSWLKIIPYVTPVRWQKNSSTIVIRWLPIILERQGRLLYGCLMGRAITSFRCGEMHA